MIEKIEIQKFTKSKNLNRQSFCKLLNNSILGQSLILFRLKKEYIFSLKYFEL